MTVILSDTGGQPVEEYSVSLVNDLCEMCYVMLVVEA